MSGTGAPARRINRRTAIAAGVGSVAAALVGGVELVDHGLLPGKRFLDHLDGACDAAAAPGRFGPVGRSLSGTFFSRARNRTVGYTIAYPPGHDVGDRLPLGLVLHADGGDHRSEIGGASLADALAEVGAPPIALVAADGGNLYWHPHPGDDPMGMMFTEVLPMCRRMGLGVAPGSVGSFGISMGGYGAILFAEVHPRRIAAVAAVSPAVWTSYAEAHGANAGAYTDAAEFAAYDAVTHVGALAGHPVRVASGASDPFHPGVMELIARLGPGGVGVIRSGCHDGAFFASQRLASLRFLGERLL